MRLALPVTRIHALDVAVSPTAFQTKVGCVQNEAATAPCPGVVVIKRVADGRYDVRNVPAHVADFATCDMSVL